MGALAAADELLLRPGETQSLPAHGPVWVENGKVLRISDLGSSFRLQGLSPGRSAVKIGHKAYDVFVLSPSQDKAQRILRPLINKSLGLEISVSQGKVRIQGELVQWRDWEKLYHSCREESCDYLMQAQMSASMKKLAQKKISQIFQQHGLPPQNLLFDKNIQTLASTQGEIADRTIRLLKAFGIEPLKTQSNLDLEPLVKVQITVAEVRKDQSLKYGIKWPGSYQAQILPKYSAGPGGANIDIQFLEQTGIAKVLASPNLICRSGKAAQFFAGGEFPMKILNYRIQDVVWRKYGIQLNLQPKADFSGKMSISIETEISSIDASRSVNQIPALFTNKIQSHFDLNESRLIALSGLIKNEQSQNSEGFPGLSGIPILGSLFSSREFKDNRTELVVFVKPEVISPGSLEADP
jgi:pilus assembly protein CpaC